MVGQKLGSFKIESKIGSGAMGEVYRATHEKTGKTAAVKVILGEAANRGNASARFLREAEILEQFRHPNIVRYLARGRYQGTSYYAMEFIQGKPLDDIIEQREFLPWREAVDLAIQLCDALQYSHTHGIIHRDLKPSNLMITEKGQLKLTDFGIAKDLDATALTATGRTLGTAAYMAPEQIRGTPAVSHKTDLYAVGCVLYQMLTGRPPFPGKTAVVLMQAHMAEPPPRPSAKNPDVPRALDDMVIKLMAKEPTERPWDAEAVGHTLRELREKAERGETIPMVFSTMANAPTSRGTDSTTSKPRKSSKGKTKTGSWMPAPGREWLEPGLLVLGLVAIFAFIGYMMWPPSAKYLYGKAEALMASDERSVWITARKDYLDELDRRFPDHPYRDQTDAWRQKILLSQAEDRAKILEGIGKPKTYGEELYLSHWQKASEEAKQDRDFAAAQTWRKMESTLRDRKDAEEEDRRWLLLAQTRAKQLERVLKARRDSAVELLNQADAWDTAKRPVDAMRARVDFLARYQKFASDDPEMATLAARAQAGLPQSPPPAAPNPSPAPEPQPPAPSAPPEDAADKKD
jgi:eukaryotic-like serine/threonine-protein kinase